MVRDGKIHSEEPSQAPERARCAQLGEAFREGLVRPSKADNFYRPARGGRNSRLEVAYFADMVNGDGSWEVTKATYDKMMTIGRLWGRASELSSATRVDLVIR